MAELEERNFVEEAPKQDKDMALEENKEDREKMDVETVQNMDERLNAKESELHNIPLSFESSTNYIEEWERLFYLEIKAQIIRSAISESESSETYFLKEGE